LAGSIWRLQHTLAAITDCSGGAKREMLKYLSALDHDHDSATAEPSGFWRQLNQKVPMTSCSVFQIASKSTDCVCLALLAATLCRRKH
jgi:hypothetical protein